MPETDATSTTHSASPSPSLDERALLHELEALRTHLQTHGPNTVCKEESADASSPSTDRLMAILRLCPGLEINEWQEMAAEANLSEWLTLPLDGDAYPHLQHLQATLRELSHKTEHDPLTGLANRRAFDRFLDVEIERAQRNTTPVSLAIFDLDDFKKVNDTYGHQCGDNVLVALGRIMSENRRRYDLAARLGGEEFAVIIPGIGMMKAKKALERILGELRDEVIACGDERVRVTASVGLASYKGRVDFSAAQLYELADEALYDAKATGKDRIVTAPIPDLGKAPEDKSLVLADEKKFLFTGFNE